MALIQCSECRHDISTEAKACPYCGTANMVISEKQKRGFNVGILWLLDVIAVLLIIVIIGGTFFIGYKSASYAGPGSFIGTLDNKLSRGDYSALYDLLFTQQSKTSASVSNGTAVILQEVKNLGYDFYVGEIDSPNANNLTDDLKNQITQIAYNAHMPVSLLKTVPIIILNNLALTGNQYIPTQAGNLNVPDLKPDFLSEGGLYETFSNGSAVIYINKPIIAKGQLTEVLSHEIGHAVGSKLTDQEWKSYYQLRNIPASQDRHGSNWNMSPEEDFAEVYKFTFTAIPVRTFYGLLVPSLQMDLGACMSTHSSLEWKYTPEVDSNDPTAWLKNMQNPVKIDYDAVESKVTADPQMQLCRRNVIADPNKYASDWTYGVPYKSSVSQAAKDFIQKIANRLK